ncbi:cupin domain-containing protein [Lacicoccus qingdaonensis]|uniref:Cupin domain-containing protein n=1 Tax=Lacicoccus qingdaonensis TaxID=576118 RepID=A0A1G9IQL5_9BACL|nr:cupin domain-containing protein [Salinicoccus qingdaonensis]SDL27263.1 Cupin domain-containing protein [Salinicoccus qingdaonensis]
MIYRTDEKMDVKNLHCGEGIIGIEKCETASHDVLKAVVKVKVPVGGSIGYHQHNDDYEGYYILNGKGTFQEKDGHFKVYAGDFCLIQKGESHGIVNDGSEDLIIFAVVLK